MVFALSIALPVFQFHKGTIKTTSTKNLNFIIGHFNSIKVQLKLLS